MKIAGEVEKLQRSKIQKYIKKSGEEHKDWMQQNTTKFWLKFGFSITSKYKKKWNVLILGVHVRLYPTP